MVLRNSGRVGSRRLEARRQPMERSQSVRGDSFFYIKFDVLNLLSNITKKIYLFLFSIFICNILAAQDQDYKIVRDISYTQSKNPYAVERCKLDLYYPENAKDFPTVVWFHGGGALSGRSQIHPEEIEELRISRYRRKLPSATQSQRTSDCIDDAAAAVAWTFSEMEKYGGDRRKIFVSGRSAGGYFNEICVGLDKKWLS